jgi:hypothetical protein
MKRRRYLALVIAGALAGCLGGGDGDSGNRGDTGSSSDDESENGPSDTETDDADKGSEGDPDLFTRQ